jgi:hypothetical protein
MGDNDAGRFRGLIDDIWRVKSGSCCKELPAKTGEHDSEWFQSRVTHGSRNWPRNWPQIARIVDVQEERG